MLKTKFPAKKTGFSLLELSIVLVVIGIIVAAVIGGVSLIKGAALRAAMAEARAYTVAATSFYNAYNTLPGDYQTQIGNSGGGTVTTQGNGDGVIQFVNGNGGSSTKAAEGLVAWQHLNNSGMITNSTYATPASVDVSVGTYAAQTPAVSIPGSKIKGGGWIFDNIGSDSFAVLTAAFASHSLAGSGTATNATVTGVISANDALAIDNKIDDGKANVGTVQATGLTGLTGCSSGATYTTGNIGAVCALGFQVNKT